MNKGLRFGPTVQQGGTQTIQQSIYLSHDNPCGRSYYLNNELGNTGYTFMDLQAILSNIMRTPESAELFKIINNYATVWYDDPTAIDDNNNYYSDLYLHAIANWGEFLNIKIQEFFQTSPTLNYGYILIGDQTGSCIYNGNTQQYPIIDRVTYEDQDGKVGLIYLPIIPNPYNNVTSDPSTNIMSLYQMWQCPQYSIFVNNLQDCNYIDFYYYFSLSTLSAVQQANASLLIDTANTRTVTQPGWGFGVSSSNFYIGDTTFVKTQIVYNVCYIKPIFYLDVDGNPSSANITSNINVILFAAPTNIIDTTGTTPNYFMADILC